MPDRCKTLSALAGGLAGATLTVLMAAGSQAQSASQSAAGSGTGGWGNWTEWGGPTRSFVANTPPLADRWPDAGPREVWRRPLGDGHSSVLVEDDRLYTMYRPAVPPGGEARWAPEEIVVALEASTGATVWEHRYSARPLHFQFGAGPYSTPLVVGDRLFALGTNNQLMALEKATGRLLWAHDLVAEFGALETLVRPAVKAGMSASPIAHDALVVVPAGGRPGQSVMAFDQRTGEVAWRAGDFGLSQASPILIEVDGQTQLVVSGGRDINGLDPATGRLLWSHPHDTDADMNISTPLSVPGNRLFVSSAYNGGSRVIQLTRRGDRTETSEVWFSPQLRIHFGTAVRVDDLILGSSGDFGPAFLTALDLETGRRLWQDRSFARAQLVQAGEHILVLDEDGTLGLIRAARSGMDVLDRADVLENLAWTPPTVVGSTLYARDRSILVRLELPRASPAQGRQE